MAKCFLNPVDTDSAICAELYEDIAGRIQVGNGKIEALGPEICQMRSIPTAPQRAHDKVSRKFYLLMFQGHSVILLGRKREKRRAKNQLMRKVWKALLEHEGLWSDYCFSLSPKTVDSQEQTEE